MGVASDWGLMERVKLISYAIGYGWELGFTMASMCPMCAKWSNFDFLLPQGHGLIT